MSQSSDAVKHVILLMFENRSFDHLLGWMSHPRFGNNPKVDGLVGDIDVATGELVDPRYRNPALGQTYRPFFVSEDAKFSSDLPHGRSGVDDQMAFSAVTNSYSMKGFAQSYYVANPGLAGPFATKPECMRMLAPSAAPMTAFLAQNFRVCDHWFTAIPTDTHPNRIMALAGYTEIDSTSTLEPNHNLVFDWAERNKIPWRVYSDEFSFMMTMRGPEVLADQLLNHRYRGFSNFAHDYQYDAEFPAITLIEPGFLDDPFAAHPNDNHPPLPMGPGEAFLLRIYSALLGTDLAKRRFNETLFVIYYDEHGGLFDHVPPLVVDTPCGRPPGQAQWPAFRTTGPRVPGIVVSPLVDATVFNGNLDHTSVLRFLAERFTPGTPYSDQVAARHAGPANLRSLGEIVNLSAPRAVPPPPNLGPFVSITFPNGRPSLTPGQNAFLEARKAAHLDHDTLAQTHPESFFIPQ
jgi:phospholipase C